MGVMNGYMPIDPQLRFQEDGFVMLPDLIAGEGGGGERA